MERMIGEDAADAGVLPSEAEASVAFVPLEEAMRIAERLLVEDAELLKRLA